jgi:hypothetical protein
VEEGEPAVGRQADVALEAVDRARERGVESGARTVGPGIATEAVGIEGREDRHMAIFAVGGASAVTVW